jgi:hypothetical protein
VIPSAGMKLTFLGWAPLVVAVAVTGCAGKHVRETTQEKIEGTPERIERGNYLVNQVTMCGGCHTPRVGGTWLGGERTDAFLAGGSVFDDREMEFKIVAPNITQDRETGIGSWTDDEIMRAVRDGVHRDGRLMLPPMPFGAWKHMSDDDARAIVAYLRTVPPVRNKIEPQTDTPFLMGMVVKMGVMHHEPARDVKAPPATDKKSHGEYLSRLAFCADCHSLGKRGPSLDKEDFFAGSRVPLSEPEYGKVWAANLTSDVETGLGKYSAQQLKDALKSGRRLDGRRMAPPMSLLIPHLSTWTEADLDALVFFLKSLPPVKHKVPEPQLTPDAAKLVAQQ